ncbi:hypothetical protein [Salipiger mucosus]|uniref:hypothetical protein n=1 Tax=Salipiger mucosus TaxID=263378 RepID=UPI0012EC9742|nr:hypothetical protein [Salipiger mucosus]
MSDDMIGVTGAVSAEVLAGKTASNQSTVIVTVISGVTDSICRHSARQVRLSHKHPRPPRMRRRCPVPQASFC